MPSSAFSTWILVNPAACATGKASAADHHRLNVEGTAALVAACQQAGVSRLLFVSSIAVTFADQTGYHYAAAKTAAEQIVHGSGLRVRVVRPTMIFGAGSPVEAPVTADGGREVLGVDVGDSEDETFWTAFLRSLKARGLGGVRLVISDAHEGLKAAVRKVISRVGMPPSTRACAKSTAVERSSMAITGTTLPAVRISRGVMRFSNVKK